MKKFLFITVLGVIGNLSAIAADRDSTVYYPVPDSIKAVSFVAGITIRSIPPKKEALAGISAGPVRLAFESEKKEKEIVFEFPDMAKEVAKGLDVSSEKGELSWKYDWALNKTYKLLIAVATDSAENFSLYSGYAWLPDENKWKLIGTCKISGQRNLIQDPAVFNSHPGILAETGEVWLQRSNGSWKQMNGDKPGITINLFSHVDSIRQLEIENQLIRQAIATGKVDVPGNIEGVYYKILKDGTGRQVSLDDTVTVLYKLTIFNDGSLVEETQAKPSVFPLKRLIKGWQLGVPQAKVGGKIRLLIPSAMAYSIRTRAPKIPPNSILLFDIEIIDVKAPL